MSTLKKADKLLRQAMADQRAVMAELKRMGKATAPQLRHVLPDPMRVKCALRGLRGRGYVHYERAPGTEYGVHHVVDEYPDDDLDMLFVSGR